MRTIVGLPQRGSRFGAQPEPHVAKQSGAMVTTHGRRCGDRLPATAPRCGSRCRQAARQRCGSRDIGDVTLLRISDTCHNLSCQFSSIVNSVLNGFSYGCLDQLFSRLVRVIIQYSSDGVEPLSSRLVLELF